jgi:membrane-bound metal-dependent hydrolase YbcI (DUF457 family)
MMDRYFPKASKRSAVALGVFTAIAADLDFLPQWLWNAPSHRGIRHSLGMAAIVCLGIAGIFSMRYRQGFWAAFRLGMIASASHLCLDLLTTGGKGIPVFWPLSSTRISSSMVIFPQVYHSEGLLYAGHIPVLLFEGAYAVSLLWITYKLVHFYQAKQHEESSEVTLEEVTSR